MRQITKAEISPLLAKVRSVNAVLRGYIYGTNKCHGGFFAKDTTEPLAEVEAELAKLMKEADTA